MAPELDLWLKGNKSKKKRVDGTSTVSSRGKEAYDVKWLI